MDASTAIRKGGKKQPPLLGVPCVLALKLRPRIPYRSLPSCANLSPARPIILSTHHMPATRPGQNLAQPQGRWMQIRVIMHPRLSLGLP